ncbi:hypothetical protein FC40_GL000363 [Ligilactobacillus hayakitensis DSM 18933 = JCM 14209]|uniref:Uncharacterized protein n=1 Tax=Ligilactobacillus hayakitensis DSM 18933 = JCM 14209 TaxID=1423755 RepID=A0A0R1WWY4_9LACO|nr:hypothetical protein FC40_GL000363 [Ligilactobacillus hayakitensis DSM 18933 = JCM 14209]
MTKYLVVGAGLFGATFAHEEVKRGHEVKIIEKNDYVAGNIYTKEVHGIQVHQFCAHIFHNYELGELEYRSLYFETEVLDEDNHQGNAVVNYTDAKTSYTREYLADWSVGMLHTIL